MVLHHALLIICSFCWQVYAALAASAPVYAYPSPSYDGETYFQVLCHLAHAADCPLAHNGLKALRTGSFLKVSQGSECLALN